MGKKMTIGERILNLIHEKGMTQKEFSALTGIPQSTMSSWKSRNQVPGMDKLQIICDVLDIDPYHLLSGAEGETKTGFIRVYETDIEYEIIEGFRKLDDARKNRLLRYLHALTGD